MPKDLTYIAKTNFRNSKQVFGIKRADRRQHMYVIGKTGVGKTAFLKNMALQDIENGQGLAIIDPHGEFVEEVLDNIPPHRINDVVYFNPADMDHPVSFNIMDVPDPKYKHLIASGLIGIFTKIWANVWSARMEYILANCILALLDTPGTTLLGIPRMLVDRDYRQKIINNLKDPVVKSFWINEYEEWDPRYRNEAIAPVQNKVGQFLNVSFVRNIVGQAKNTIDVDEIMNNQKILLVNVSKGRIGEDNAAILGAMIITKIQLSAMERVRIPEDERKDFYLYVDEFQNFATDSFVNILSEARKYRLNLIIAHQYIGQLITDTSTAVRDAVFGNVGTMLSFRVGATDAEALELEFTPEFLQTDLIRLDNYNIYIKLMIDGITSRPFSATTIAPAPVVKDDKKREQIIKISRSKYAHPVRAVEEEINRWAGNMDVPGGQSSADIFTPHNFPKVSNKSNVAPRPSDSTKLYDAICSNCGKATKVIFPPTEGRAVYCKSCLKKTKAGETRQKPEGHFDGPATKLPQASLGGKSGETSALGDLGIEFKSSKPFSLNEVMQKGEVVPFNQSRKDKTAQRAPRKPVDLEDLRKTLDQALQKPKENSPSSFEDTNK
ncbi:MAG: type IV secretion system DNA-binding domain-containing protein [Candidatus Staskawiczbacteria bacterium]|nr:type IV secretion system DNA-binding domain-containing protein [Candidatus Staskawiczbacteria bacterium]